MTESLQLDQVRAGQTVRLLDFARCRRNGLRLAELGLTPGTIVDVLQASRGQPMLLRVRGAQLAVDRGTAHKIQVQATSGWNAHRGRGPHRRRRHTSHRRGRRQGQLKGQHFPDQECSAGGDSSES